MCILYCLVCKTVSWQSLITFSSYNLSSMFSAEIPQPWWRDKDLLCKAEWSCLPLFVHTVVWKKMATEGSSTVNKYGIVRVGVALLEEICHYGSRLWGLIDAQDTHSERPFPVECESRCKNLNSSSSTFAYNAALLPSMRTMD